MKPTEYIVREILKRPQAKPPKETKTATVYSVKRREQDVNWLEIRIPKPGSSQFKKRYIEMLRDFCGINFTYTMDDLIDLLMALEKEENQ